MMDRVPARFAPLSPLGLIPSFRGANSSHNPRPESAVSTATRPVCSPLPAKPYSFVSGSKFFTQLPAEKCDFADIWTSRFAPLSPLGLIPSFRGANSSHNSRPESAISPASGPAGLLPAPREALSLRFGEQILHTTPGRKVRFRRRPGRPVCSPLPARPYSFVPGSKFFTQLPAGKCDFAGVPAGRFAPLSPLSLIPSFRGANSSHNFRPESAISPASGPAGLLPVPREALSLRFGEQILHITPYCFVGLRQHGPEFPGTPAFFVQFFLVLDRKKQCATFLSTSHTASL